MKTKQLQIAVFALLLGMKCYAMEEIPDSPRTTVVNNIKRISDGSPLKPSEVKDRERATLPALPAPPAPPAPPATTAPPAIAYQAQVPNFGPAAWAAVSECRWEPLCAWWNGVAPQDQHED